MNPARTFVAYARGLFLISLCFAGLTWAAVPLASQEADRQAKFAVPAAGEALVYVYRRHGGVNEGFAVTVSGRDTARLGPGTFVMSRVRPGRVEVTAEGAGDTFAFRAEPGRVYYLELAGATAGIAQLRPVPFAVGRPGIQRLRLVTSAAHTPPAAPPAARPRTHGGLAFSVGSGAFSLAEESQTFVGAPRRFDGSASSIYALEGEWFVEPAVSLGVEVVGYSTDYTTPGGGASGSADTTAVVLNVRRYLRPGSGFQPYAGFGLGSAIVDFTGGITGSTSGPALQFAAGVRWRPGRVLVSAEYKYLDAVAEDGNRQEIDLSGSGAFLGIGLHF